MIEVSERKACLVRVREAEAECKCIRKFSELLLESYSHNNEEVTLHCEKSRK